MSKGLSSPVKLIGAEFVLAVDIDGLAVKLNESGSDWEYFTWSDLAEIGIARYELGEQSKPPKGWRPE